MMELFSRRRTGGRSDATQNWWDLEAKLDLVVLVEEVGGRWSAETRSFLAHLAKARSRQEDTRLRPVRLGPIVLVVCLSCACGVLVVCVCVCGVCGVLVCLWCACGVLVVCWWCAVGVLVVCLWCGCRVVGVMLVCFWCNCGVCPKPP